MKNKYIEFIQQFNKITIKRICEEIGINPKNVYGGNTKRDNLELVALRLRYELERLLLENEFYGVNEYYNHKKIEVLEEKEND